MPSLIIDLCTLYGIATLIADEREYSLRRAIETMKFVVSVQRAPYVAALLAILGRNTQ